VRNLDPCNLLAEFLEELETLNKLGTVLAGDAMKIGKANSVFLERVVSSEVSKGPL
jgi:hypothetical protein